MSYRLGDNDRFLSAIFILAHIAFLAMTTLTGAGSGPGKVIPNNELVEMAKKEINEDPKRTPADIKHIREWIKKQPHLAKSARQG